MIEETASVIDVRDGQALLQTERKSACQSCSVKSGCGTSTLSKVVGKRSTQLVVQDTLGLRPGDQVIVAVEENALVQGSLLVYLLPLVVMLAAGILAELAFASEGVTILAVLAGLLLSIWLVRAILSMSSLQSSIRPHLVRRLS